MLWAYVCLGVLIAAPRDLMAWGGYFASAGADACRRVLAVRIHPRVEVGA